MFNKKLNLLYLPLEKVSSVCSVTATGTPAPQSSVSGVWPPHTWAWFMPEGPALGLQDPGSARALPTGAPGTLGTCAAGSGTAERGGLEGRGPGLERRGALRPQGWSSTRSVSKKKEQAAGKGVRSHSPGHTLCVIPQAQPEALRADLLEAAPLRLGAQPARRALTCICICGLNRGLGPSRPL